MSRISRARLFGKLNSLAYRAIESATVFCKMRGNPYVELAHWVHQILQLQDSDLHRIIKEFDVEPGRLAKDLTAALDSLPRGATSISDLSAHVEEAVERGWVYGSLAFGEPKIRTGHLVVGMLNTNSLRNALNSISKEFSKLKVEKLTDHFDDIVGGSPEDRLGAHDGSTVGGGADPGEASGAMSPAQMGKAEALAKFTVDLTEEARTGKMDPIVGRDEEIRQIVDILMRRRQNNPIVTGEAGVGKTAVVEGFAQRIAAGDVPPPLQGVSLRSLDVGLLQAGASMKGEFENRLKQVIEEVQSSPEPIILFIDEAHTLVGAGGAAGTGDAANLLKPALARGDLRTIGATTWAEYKKHIEKDPALTRRFQVVQVDEPSEERAILMMRRIATMMEKHHRVQILDEALEASVKLSHRYIPARQLPDKSVSLLDTACARVAISQHSVPAEVEDSRRRIEALENELEIIGRESAVGYDTTERETHASELLSQERERLSALEADWEKEKGLVDQILSLRGKLRGEGQPVEGTGSELEEAAAEATAEEDGSEAPAVEASDELTESERAELLEQLAKLQDELAEIQGERPLILPSVDSQAVAAVVADWTGIPVGRMVKNEIETILSLPEILRQRVVGQDHAMEMIARRIQTSRARLDNPNKPIGVFMLAGPSGVGKTETALALAETLYGGEQNIITINMSEFQESHTVSTLKGAPPGYVGYGEGGILTEAVRRKPYSVVLLDEVEKAHSDVHEIFFQVFDKGLMEDGEGRLIDFKNTLIVLTTNAGTDLIMSMCQDPELMPDAEGISKALKEPLLKEFPPALLGRIVAIPYYPLNKDMITAISKLQLNRI
ncbi:MAG: type VI secretion system ATPase TssH, partial [Gammaproteobacteria bacterium]|nr:type VI secretion system ATPase TssH [Gammaproteobacteria bacterium]